MLTEKRIERLKAAGFIIGDVGEFLELTDAERQLVELRAAIALRVRALRKEHRLTQAALAKRMGSSQPRVARIEDGAEGSLDLAFRAYFAAGGSFDPAGLVVKPARVDKPARPKTRAKAATKANPKKAAKAV